MTRAQFASGLPAWANGALGLFPVMGSAYWSTGLQKICMLHSWHREVHSEALSSWHHIL